VESHGVVGEVERRGEVVNGARLFAEEPQQPLACRQPDSVRFQSYVSSR
jgi:hypothetical protein